MADKQLWYLICRGFGSWTISAIWFQVSRDVTKKTEKGKQEKGNINNPYSELLLNPFLSKKKAFSNTFDLNKIKLCYPMTVANLLIHFV